MFENALEVKKRCIDLIERFPEEYLLSLAVSLEKLFNKIDDAADDAYCLELYRSSFNNDNDFSLPFEQFAKELGIENN